MGEPKGKRSWATRLRDENHALKKKLEGAKGKARALQKSLNEAHKLLKNLPGGIVLIQQGKIVFLNETARKGLGYDEKDMLGRSFLEFIHPDHVESLRDRHRKRISGKPVPNLYETYLMTKDGRTLCCEVRVRKIRYQGRRAFLLNIVGLDYRKELEKRISHSYKMQALNRMSLGLSVIFDRHLSLLRAYEFDRKEADPPQDRALIRSWRKVDAARESVERIQRQLACLTRLENEPSDVGILDLRTTVQEAVALTRPHWEEDRNGQGPDIKLKTYLRALSPVRGCAQEIRDAVVNIILNAADALSYGGEIYVTTEESEGLAHVYVQDNGTGISEDIKDYIFEPFFTTREESRTGLGLTLAQAIITRNRGDLEVISEHGQGTTFVLKLPVVQESPVSRPGPTTRGIKDFRFLIITEEDIVRELLSQLLMNKGGETTVALTAKEGLKLLGRHAYHMAIADLNTPDLQTPIITKKLRTVARSLPVVLVDAKGKQSPSKALKKYGADLMISRPLNMDRVLSLISGVLSKYAFPQ